MLEHLDALSLESRDYARERLELLLVEHVKGLLALLVVENRRECIVTELIGDRFLVLLIKVETGLQHFFGFRHVSFNFCGPLNIHITKVSVHRVLTQTYVLDWHLDIDHCEVGHKSLKNLLLCHIIWDVEQH